MNSSVWNGFRWEGNLLRTRGLKPGQEQEKMFWLLRWEDKVSRDVEIESMRLKTDSSSLSTTDSLVPSIGRFPTL